MHVKELRLDLDADERDPDIIAKKDILQKLLEGNWTSNVKGQGIEFAGYRKYTPEDDAREIDWRASLKSDDLLVREYEGYKTLNVYVLADTSDTMLFTSQEKFKAEYGIQLAFDICEAVANTGDAIGFGMFTNKLETQVSPAIGTGILPKIKQAMREPENYGGESDLSNVLKLVNASAQDPALIMIISDFLSLSENWERYLGILAQRMQLLGIMLRDPRDRDLPSSGGQFVLENPDGSESVVTDTHHIKEEYGQAVEEQERFIEGTFRKNAANFVRVTSGPQMYDPLLGFFKRLNRVEG